MKKTLLITLIGLFGMAAKAQDSLGCDLSVSFTYSISGGEITFTNTSTGEPDDAMYEWFIDDLSSTEENPTFPTTDFEDSELVCFTVYDSLWECHDSLCMTIYFEDDSLGCDLSASFTYTISGGEITFTNTSTGEPADAMYDWTIDDLSSTEENPTFPTTDFEDSELVCFTVYDSLWECHDSLCMTIYFDDDSLCDLNVSFTYSISGGEITFTNTSTGEPLDAGYQWWIDDLSSTEENPTFPTTDFEDSEEVCLSILDPIGECFDTLCLTIYFDDDSLGCDLSVSFTYSISGGEITFTNTSTGEPDDAMYEWFIDDLSSTEENPTFPTTDFEDSELVCFTVYDSLWECHDSLCLTIYFDDDSISDSTASIIFLEDEAVSIYPNPAINVLNISVKNATSVQRVYIYNAIGEIIRMDQIGLNTSTLEVDIEQLPGGLYIVHIVDEENPTNNIQRKFVKK